MHLLSPTASTAALHSAPSVRKGGGGRKGVRKKGGRTQWRKKKRDRGVAFVTAETTAFVLQRCRGTRATNVNADKRPEAPPCTRSHAGTDALVHFLLGRMGFGRWRGWGGTGTSVDEELQCAGGVHKINKATNNNVSVCAVTCLHVHETCTMDTGRLQLVGWYHYSKYRWHKCARLAHIMCVCAQVYNCTQSFASSINLRK